MKSFEFKSQVATSKEQSKRLLELGLKRETADMCYKVTTHDWKGKEIPEKERRYSLCAFYDEIDLVCGFQRIKTIPAWSLHRLLLLLNCAYVELDVNNPFEDCITRIEFMIKESKIFNKDYLEDKK